MIVRYLSLVFGIFIFSFSNGQSDTTISKTYSKKGFKIKYNKDWRLDTSGLYGTELFLFTQLQDSNDVFSENINIIIQKLSPSNNTLAKYKSISEQQFSQNKKTKLLESVILKSKSKDYIKMVYEMKQADMMLKFISFCYIKNNQAYLATFTAKKSTFNTYYLLAYKSMMSFVD